MQTSKFYSNKSNARRAAKTAEVADFNIIERAHPTVAGATQYAWQAIEATPAPVAEPAPAPAPAPVEAPEPVATPAPTQRKARQKGAVSKAWDIFAANPGMARKDAIQTAVDAGVNYYTARTQFQQYFKALNS